MSQGQEPHWYDTAIERAKVVSETLEVAKAWGAYIAEWVLLLCLIMNIVQMFPIVPAVVGNVVLVIQAISLDIAGFGLTSMGAHARRNGNQKAALRASVMGWALISLMILTVILVTVPFVWPDTKNFAADCDKFMILLRVIVTVFYGHVVHSVRSDNKTQEIQTANLAQEVSTLQKEVDTLRPQVDTLSGHLQKKSQEVDTLQKNLSTAQQQVSTLENELSSGGNNNAVLRKQLSEVQVEVEALRVQLDGKQRELAGMREMVESGQDWKETRITTLQKELETEQGNALTLRRQLNAAQSETNTLQVQLDGRLQELAGLRQQVKDSQDWQFTTLSPLQQKLENELTQSATLRRQLDAKQRELESVHFARESDQQEVSTLRKQVSTLQKLVDSGQAQKVSTTRTKVDSGRASGHPNNGESGQGKVVQLDTTRSRRNGQDEDELAERIKEMLLSDSQLSDRSIAKQLGCSPTTVGRKRSAMGLTKDEESAVNE
ncbi:MAG: hypothetical protein PVS3B3_18880 [Ktedonobacteraceae bacterium]